MVSHVVVSTSILKYSRQNRKNLKKIAFLDPMMLNWCLLLQHLGTSKNKTE
jgi:hypothetical protein